MSEGALKAGGSVAGVADKGVTGKRISTPLALMLKGALKAGGSVVGVADKEVIESR